MDARNCAIFMTSNLGIKEQENCNIGFGHNEPDKINKAVKNFFSPEFRNRLDEIIQFGYLQKEQLIYNWNKSNYTRKRNNSNIRSYCC